MADYNFQDTSAGLVGRRRIVHVVRGTEPQPERAGEIVDATFDRNHDSHLLRISWVERGNGNGTKRREGYTAVTIKDYYRRKGWMTLEDAYIADDNRAGYEEYCKFSEAQRKDPAGMRGVEFPGEWPSAVKKLLASRGEDKPETQHYKAAAAAKKAAEEKGEAKALPEPEPKESKPRGSRRG